MGEQKPIQESLREFGSNTEATSEQLRPSTTPRLASKASQFEHSVDEGFGSPLEDQLPDIGGRVWDPTTLQRGPAKVAEFEDLGSKAYWNDYGEDDEEDVPGSGAIVLSGAEQYLRKYGLTSLALPDYYSRFEDRDPAYRWSADRLTVLHGRFLRRCVRLSNGKGRIESNQTHTVLCSPGTVAVSGPRGLFLVELPASRLLRDKYPLPEPPRDVHHSVKGIDIPEENPALRRGFERFVSMAERNSSFETLVGYHSFDGNHTLETETGTVTLTANSLRLLESQDKAPTSLAGEYEKYVNGDTISVTVNESDFPGQIGDELSVDPPSEDWFGRKESPAGTIAGYRVNWIENGYLSPGSPRVNRLALVARTVTVTPNLDVKLFQIPLWSDDL